MYLRNCWYAIGQNDDVCKKTLFARTILDEPIVLYRCSDGLLYIPDGKCIEVPGQSVVPPDASVRTYLVVERYNLVWLWMGYPEQADTATLPTATN